MDQQLAQLEQRVHQLETCYKITSLLNSELNLSNLLDTIMNVTKKVMNADACSLLLVDEETDELGFQIALSDVGEKIKSLARLKMGEGIAGTVAKTGAWKKTWNSRNRFRKASCQPPPRNMRILLLPHRPTRPR